MESIANIKSIEALLERVREISWCNRKLRDATGADFNMFKICGVNHYENTHSAIIAELLNPEGCHNQRDQFLEAFLQMLKQNRIIDDGYCFDTSKAEVITEFGIGGLGRIDILIRNQSQCIVIENKIYAEDQHEQLKRYAQYAENKYPQNHLLLYLTLVGDDASEDSGHGVDYKAISYEHTMVQWLGRCVEIAARTPIVRETIVQYINHIQYLTNSNQDAKMNEELIQLLAQKDNLDALFLISENKAHVQNHIINKVFLPQLHKECEKLGLQCMEKEEDRVNKPYSGFMISHPDWKYFQIGFEFAARGLRNADMGFLHLNETKRNELTFSKLKSSFQKSNNNWVWDPFTAYPTWGIDAMKSILDGKMAAIFREQLNRLLDIAKDLEM